MVCILTAQGGRIESDGKITLEAAQEAVGGYVEMIRFGNRQMLVNEEGLLKDLPANQEATALAGVKIVGNVVVLDGKSKWS